MDPRANRRSWYATGLGVVILAALLVVGKRWWDRVDADFKNNRLYRTRPAISQVKQSPAGNQLDLLLENSKDQWYDSTRLVTDHGKLMHLFLVRQPGADAFAHLHPVRKEGANEFTSALPAVPTGKYWLFADVTHESGFAETYTSEVEIPRTESVSKENFDPDDSWWNEGSSSRFRIERTSSGNVKTGHQVTLDFRVYDSKGQPASVDFYMGMPAHAMILRQDASVFTHIHPLGTVSMAAQQLFVQRDSGSAPTSSADALCGKPSSEVRFPYAFPKSGKYRVWVQAKVAGEIVTARFDFQVSD